MAMTPISFEDIPELLQTQLEKFGFWQAGLVYIVIYTIRPLVLFPAAILTLISGAIFGPVWGIIFTIIGENLSANVAFFAARWLGRQWVSDHESQNLKKWEQQLKDNGFLTVLTLRLIMLPFDAVNYGCGLTSVRHRDYALGTFIGILPGLVSFVLAGASFNSTNPWTIAASSVLLLFFAYFLSFRIKKSLSN